MKWSPSILAQVATLALATLILAFIFCFGIVVLTPVPGPVRMTVRDAAETLRGRSGAALDMAVRASAPAPPRVVEVEAALVRMLRVPPDRVRVQWLDGDGAGKGIATGQSVVLVGDRTLLVNSDASGFRMRYGAGVQIGPDVVMPAFEAAIQQVDGRWRTVTPVDRHLAAWRLRLLQAFGLTLALSAALVWLAARRISIPIRQLAASAARSDLGGEAPFHNAGPPEIKAVATAMSAMHKRLAGQAEERFQAFAAIAHDLRTPLTGLRIRAELVPPSERIRMIDDLDRMAAMIDDVLSFARIDRQRVDLQMHDLAALLTKVMNDRRALGQEVRLADHPDSVWAMIDKPLLYRAIDNLLDNAIRYAGGAFLSLENEGEEVCIHVEDRGPGIPADAISGIVTPFKRLDPSRSRATGGVGLGLAIAERVTVAHRGRLILENQQPQGLRATLALPASHLG